jgi:hypothetical protein
VGGVSSQDEEIYSGNILIRESTKIESPRDSNPAYKLLLQNAALCRLS